MSQSFDQVEMIKSAEQAETAIESEYDDDVVESSVEQGWGKSIFEAARYTYSLALITFCVVTVMAVIGTKQSSAADNGIPVGVAIPLFWAMIIWLAWIEGGQGALVGLQPTPKEAYAESHPITYKNCVLAHAGDNMERYIVGRQFLVVLP